MRCFPAAILTNGKYIYCERFLQGSNPLPLCEESTRLIITVWKHRLHFSQWDWEQRATLVYIE